VLPNSLVLLVDDDRNLLDCLGYILEDEGYEVARACNGSDALLQLDRLRPALIVLDAKMPILDGFATLQAIRGNTKTAHVPVIFTTAWPEETEVHGATALLQKPFKAEALLEHVAKYAVPGTRYAVIPRA
jgi:CheY-like chemotaxis protein